MSIIVNGGRSPLARKRTVPDLLCSRCNERKPGIFTVTPNGGQVCPDCAGSVGQGVLRHCDKATCKCQPPREADEE